jgi:hypothetical protein
VWLLLPLLSKAGIAERRSGVIDEKPDFVYGTNKN